MSSPSLIRWAALGAIGMLGASCQVIHGLDEYQTEPIEPAATTTSSGSIGGASGTAGGGGGGASLGHGGDTSVGAGPPPEECKGGDGVCLSEAPLALGWMGYFSIYSTALGDGSAKCPDGSTPERVFSEPSTMDASCAACACNTTFVCSGSLVTYSDSGCTSSTISYSVSQGCKDIYSTNFPYNVDSVTTGPAAMSSLGCAPSGGEVVDRGPMWGAEHALCAATKLPEGECAAGDACVDKSDANICIRINDDIAGCPEGWEMALHVKSYAGGADERGCGACSCTPPAGNLCTGGTYQLFNNFEGCAGAPDNTVGESAPCTVTSSATNVKYVPPTGNTCTPAGGAPTGSVAPTQIVTLCCR